MNLDFIYRFIGRLRWLRLGIRYRIILKLAKQDLSFETNFFGYKYKGKLDDYIDRFVFYFGAYEFEELVYLKKFINKNSIVLDIGANSGHHSLFFSKFSKKVYSFEPYKKVFDILNDRIEYNNIKNIIPYNFGLGKVDGFMDFFASGNFNQGMGSFVDGDNKISVGKLAIKNGSDFVLNNIKENIDFIKIDVEGMERDVILGLKKIINKDKPVIFMEANSEFQNDEATIKDVFSGYRIYFLDANNPFLLFFNKPWCKVLEFRPSKFVKNILLVPLEKYNKSYK